MLAFPIAGCNEKINVTYAVQGLPSADYRTKNGPVFALVVYARDDNTYHHFLHHASTKCIRLRRYLLNHKVLTGSRHLSH